jgi:hypothetical protein
MKTSERYQRATRTNDALRQTLKAYLETNILSGKSMAEAYAQESLPADTDFETMGHILTVLSGSLKGASEARELAGKGRVAQALEMEQGITSRLKSAVERYQDKASSAGSASEQLLAGKENEE